MLTLAPRLPGVTCITREYEIWSRTTFYDLCPSWDTIDQVEGGSGLVIEYLTFMIEHGFGRR